MAVDGNAIVAAMEAGASKIELEDMREDMYMTRYVTDPAERDPPGQPLDLGRLLQPLRRGPGRVAVRGGHACEDIADAPRLLALGDQLADVFDQRLGTPGDERVVLGHGDQARDGQPVAYVVLGALDSKGNGILVVIGRG